jgi:hypothetical protein
LEDNVAKLCKRKPRPVCVRYASSAKTIDIPRLSKRIRRFSADSLDLGYVDGWPTFGEMTYVNVADPWSRMTLGSYFWQWGLLWERNWSGLDRARFGISADEPIELFVPRLVEAVEREKAAYDLFADPESCGFDVVESWLRLLSPTLWRPAVLYEISDLSCLDAVDANRP